ncbi:nucleotidyltransferase-like protein [Krasilnikovia cinnamomea]|uniref:Nucleotidyltransferase-like protein n=1 Tax=Krasilnikovia cinnamomea TaxID=349313 RepID=A0A4Q7ZDL1_9ACTN|nr:nucleotidyltransferase domain-containing protein [Krasilnikovia cinnamomea]RZU48782.1 nucleotidyltransferase-like protein [Krasilnikovia cinnamomea]
MHNDQSATHEPTALSPERVAEVDEIIGRVTRWAAHRTDVVGLLLAGSYARNAARPDSDIDLVLLTTDEVRYVDNTWAHELAIGDLIRVQSWGAVTERRFCTSSGLEVEINIGSPDWASIHPLDAGTRRVVTDGARTLHDPTGALDKLIRACQP